MTDKLKGLLVSSGGLGYMPIASGTWGSLPPVILWAILILLYTHPGSGLMNGLLLLVAVLASIACVGLGRWSEQRFGKKDPGEVVADEVAGQALALLFLPVVTLPFGPTWLGLITPGIAAFFAFRFFDITKIFPADRLQKIPYGWGILLDDLVAGIYANIAIQICAIVYQQFI